jgi:hypothetical protein
MSQIVNSPPARTSEVPYVEYGQQPHRSRRWIWIVVAILLLSCLVSMIQLAVGIGQAVRPFARPTITVDQYYTAIKVQDYARAYTFLDASLTSSMTQEQFIALARQSDAAAGIVSSVQTIMPDIASNPAERVIVQATRSNGTSYTVHLQLHQVGNEWKITAFDGI